MFHRAAELDPTDQTVWLDLGDMLAAHRRPAEARAAYEAALQRRADDPRARAALAKLLTRSESSSPH